ncbi:hypothetical protein ABTK45_19520, partial [Acinetobacter baumannii]
ERLTDMATRGRGIADVHDAAAPTASAAADALHRLAGRLGHVQLGSRAKTEAAPAAPSQPEPAMATPPASTPPTPQPGEDGKEIIPGAAIDLVFD